MTLLIFNNGIASALNTKKKKYDIDTNKDIKHFLLSSNSNDQSNDKTKESHQKNSDTSHTQSTVKTLNSTHSDSLENKRLLYVKDIMLKPAVTVMPHELVIRAVNIMQLHNVSQVVVVNSDKQPLGMIGTKDLLKISNPKTSFIQNILDPQALAVSEETLVRDVALNFMKYNTSIFAVINSNNQVVGTIGRSDLLKLLVSTTSRMKNL